MDDQVVGTGSVLLHHEKAWPCAMCRPQIHSKGGIFLCVDCAHKTVMSSFARFGGRLPRPDSVEDTLAFLETTAALDPTDAETKTAAAWDLLGPDAFDLNER